MFYVGENGWVFISEIGVDSKYCGLYLSDVIVDGFYIFVFFMFEENNGNGMVFFGFVLFGFIFWCIIIVGENLKFIVEIMILWDVVEFFYLMEYIY